MRIVRRRRAPAARSPFSSPRRSALTLWATNPWCARRLFELRTKERELISEISGGQGQNKNMASRIAALDEQVVRQQELLYNVEFQLQQMERRVARAGGVRSEEETRALNGRIEKLTTVLEAVNTEHSMLMEQVKHSEEDLLRARRANASLRQQKQALESVAAALRLENEMISRQVKGSAAEKEKTMVDHDVMKLVRVLAARLWWWACSCPGEGVSRDVPPCPCAQEVKRLRDILALHADEVFSLENRKFQLQMSAQERRHEVEVHRCAPHPASPLHPPACRRRLVHSALSTLRLRPPLLLPQGRSAHGAQAAARGHPPHHAGAQGARAQGGEAAEQVRGGEQQAARRR